MAISAILNFSQSSGLYRPMQRPHSLKIQARRVAQFTLLISGLLLPTAQGQGNIEAWGADVYHQVYDTPTGPGYLSVAAGGTHSAAVRADGSLVSWGINDMSRNDAGQVTNTPGGVGFTTVVAGRGHSMAMRADGSLVSWETMATTKSLRHRAGPASPTSPAAATIP